MTSRKLENPFTSVPEPNVKFWTAKSKPMKEFREFFEKTCMSRTGPISIAVVGDVGSGKTRLFEYLTVKFKLDSNKVVCYVNLHDVFNELKSPKYLKEIDVRFLQTFYNKIYQQLESTYNGILKNKDLTKTEKDFAKKIVSLIIETKKQIIKPRLELIETFEGMINDKEKEIGRATTKNKREKLERDKQALEMTIKDMLREELFTRDEFHSFLKILLNKLREEHGIEIFTIYVDELERITEMERDFNLPLKSKAESDLRDHLVQEFGSEGLKIIVACTRNAWMNFTDRFHSSFSPKEIPSLDGEDLREAIKDHLRRVRQEKYNPFTYSDAVNLIAYYSYRNFRRCMEVLRYCYDEYVRNYEKGETDWECTLKYIIENHFDKLIRIQFFHECVRMLEKQFSPKYKRAQIERWLYHILVQFKEFDYDSMWKSFKYEIDTQHEFDLFVTTLRNSGVISELVPNLFVVMRENFAITETTRDPTDEKFLTIFYEMTAGKREVQRVAYFNKLRLEGFDDITIMNRIKGLPDLQLIEDKVWLFGSTPGALDTIKGIIRDVGRQSPKVRVEKEEKQFVPYILSHVWEWEAEKYKEQDNTWLVSLMYDPSTAGSISRKIPGVVFFRDYRYIKPSPEDFLKNDIRNIAQVLAKNRNLQFGLVICVYSPPLPTTFLGLPRVRAVELQKIENTPILWRRLFGVIETVYGTQNRTMMKGYDLTLTEEEIKLSNMVFVLPIFGGSEFPKGSKLEDEKIINYVLARDRILSVFGRSDVEEKFLTPALTDIKNVIVNPIYDKFLKDLLEVIWEINLPIKRIPDELAWPQRLRRRKWIDNENTLKILDDFVVNGLAKVDKNNLQIWKSLVNTGLFDYRGGKELEEVFLKRDIALHGKFVPKQFNAIFNLVADEQKDANHIFVKFLQEHAPFKSDIPEESVLFFNTDKLKATKRMRSLVAGVDLALYIMSKIFPEHIAQTRQSEDNRFAYKLLKEKIDPQEFVKDVNKLKEVISFLTKKGFKLQAENDEFQELQKISKKVETKIGKALESDAVVVIVEDNESKLTGERLAAHIRTNELLTRIQEEIKRINEAFCAYPRIIDWLKNPYCEEYNEQGLIEKEGLFSLPNEIKKNLLKIVRTWLESEGFARKERVNIRKQWENEVWSKFEKKLEDEAKMVTTRIAGIKKQMKIVPNITSISNKFIESTSLSFEDYIKFLKPVKNVRNVVLALTVARVSIEGAEGISEFAKKDVASYNARLADTCCELIKTTKDKIDSLREIFSEAAKIDECRTDVEKYQKTLLKASKAFSTDLGFMYATIQAGRPNIKELKKDITSILHELTINQQYGIIVLQIFSSDANRNLSETLSKSLLKTKLSEYRKKLKSIEKFCNTYNVKFKKNFWKSKEELCKSRYDLFAKTYIDGIWQQLEVIKFNGTEIRDMTACRQYIDKFNEERLDEIIKIIPKELEEPYSTILKKIKGAHETRKIFETILKLISSKKVRQQLKPDEVLKFLREVEKFGLLW